MAITLESWEDSALPGVREWSVGAYAEEEKPSFLPLMFDMKSDGNLQVENFVGVDNVGDFTRFDSTGQIEFEDVVQGYKTQLTQRQYSKGIKITYYFQRFELYDLAKDLTEGLGAAAARTREKLGAGVFINAFNSGVTYSDEALPLCSTAHTSRQDSGYTQSNSGTASLNAVNLEVARLAMDGFTDGNQNKISAVGDLILVHPNNYVTAYEILASKGKVDTANNNANFHVGRYKLVVWPYLNSTSDWWLIDSKQMKKKNKWIDADAPTFFKDKDFGSLQAGYAGQFICTFGPKHWNWIYGNQVS